MGLFGKKKDEFIKIKVENLIDWKEPNGEGCIVSDKITKEGYKVGYMYREQPDEGRPDSGWRFMAGNEDDEYMNNPNNHHIFAVNTICNYDKDIIPYFLFHTIAIQANGAANKACIPSFTNAGYCRFLRYVYPSTI